MSKRKRQPKETRPAEEKANSNAFGVASIQHVEPQFVFSSTAFDEYEEILDAQLDALVHRWVHLAAPAASVLRRSLPQAARRTSEQA